MRRSPCREVENTRKSKKQQDSALADEDAVQLVSSDNEMEAASTHGTPPYTPTSPGEKRDDGSVLKAAPPIPEVFAIGSKDATPTQAEASPSVPADPMLVVLSAIQGLEQRSHAHFSSFEARKASRHETVVKHVNDIQVQVSSDLQMLGSRVDNQAAHHQQLGSQMAEVAKLNEFEFKPTVLQSADAVIPQSSLPSQTTNAQAAAFASATVSPPAQIFTALAGASSGQPTKGGGKGKLGKSGKSDDAHSSEVNPCRLFVKGTLRPMKSSAMKANVDRLRPHFPADVFAACQVNARNCSYNYLIDCSSSEMSKRYSRFSKTGKPTACSSSWSARPSWSCELLEIARIGCEETPKPQTATTCPLQLF